MTLVTSESKKDTQIANEEDEILPYEYSITSYGADYPVDTLVKRINRGDIYIPRFQREYIWNIGQASRFIESLLLGLPVPGVFFAIEPDSQKLLVIDGLQRLKTLQYFYNGIFEPDKKEFSLQDIPSGKLQGLTYQTLPIDYRRRLDDSIIPVTIVKQDEPYQDSSIIFHIFERLNTGGSPLTSQEIRSAIFHGEFNDLLSELNHNSSWRSMFGKVDKRMRDIELILRFLALYYKGSDYKQPMKRFLNSFIGKNRHLAAYSKEQVTAVFAKTVELVHKTIGVKAFKPKKVINASILDSVMVGVAKRLEKGDISSPEQLKQKYNELLENPVFLTSTLNTTHTTDENHVRTRLNLAIQAFDNVA
jgi:hypothetical protein